MQNVRLGLRRLAMSLVGLAIVAQPVGADPPSAQPTGVVSVLVRRPQPLPASLLTNPVQTADVSLRFVPAKASDSGSEAAYQPTFADEVPLLRNRPVGRGERSVSSTLQRAFFGLQRVESPDVAIPDAVDGTVRVWQWLPDGLLYKSYLAGEKESRFATAWLYEFDRGWVWDATLGGRIGIARLGTAGSVAPEGWQFDIEGAAFPRLDLESGEDLESADFRIGLPITWSRGRFEGRFGYYHISSHVGDEFLERNPEFKRVNYVRDSLLLAIAYWLTPDVRVYSEAAYAFSADGGAEPWEFQFGAEYSPAIAGLAVQHGSPFVAFNAHLFEEHDFGGSVNVLAGWQWRGSQSDRLLRIGLQYFNGKSSQYAFFDEHEQLLGFGAWLDY